MTRERFRNVSRAALILALAIHVNCYAEDSNELTPVASIAEKVGDFHLQYLLLVSKAAYRCEITGWWDGKQSYHRTLQPGDPDYVKECEQATPGVWKDYVRRSPTGEGDEAVFPGIPKGSWRDRIGRLEPDPNKMVLVAKKGLGPIVNQRELIKTDRGMWTEEPDHADARQKACIESQLAEFKKVVKNLKYDVLLKNLGVSGVDIYLSDYSLKNDVRQNASCRVNGEWLKLRPAINNDGRCDIQNSVAIKAMLDAEPKPQTPKKIEKKQLVDVLPKPEQSGQPLDISINTPKLSKRVCVDTSLAVLEKEKIPFVLKFKDLVVFGGESQIRVGRGGSDCVINLKEAAGKDAVLKSAGTTVWFERRFPPVVSDGSNANKDRQEQMIFSTNGASPIEGIICTKPDLKAEELTLYDLLKAFQGAGISTQLGSGPECRAPNEEHARALKELDCKVKSVEAFKEYERDFEIWNNRFKNEMRAKRVAAVFNDFSVWAGNTMPGKSQFLGMLGEFKIAKEELECPADSLKARSMVLEPTQSAYLCVSRSIAGSVVSPKAELAHLNSKAEDCRNGVMSEKDCKKWQEFLMQYKVEGQPRLSVTFVGETLRVCVDGEKVCARRVIATRQDIESIGKLTFEEVYAGDQVRYLNRDDFIKTKLAAAGCSKYASVAGENADYRLAVAEDEKWLSVGSRNAGELAHPEQKSAVLQAL